MNITPNIDQITFDDFGEVGYMTAMWLIQNLKNFVDAQWVVDMIKIPHCVI